MRWLWCSVFSVAAALGCEPKNDVSPAALAATQNPSEPPLVLSGGAKLECTISSRENGRQKLVLDSGQGLEFDVAVSPIVDGIVETSVTNPSASYRFTSHLAAPGQGSLTGVGKVRIEKLETRVRVEMQRYDQPKGPGTELSFRSEDMLNKGVYVEFRGDARAENGDVYRFRVSLGAAGPGSGGRVQPASNAESAPIAAKMVMIEAPQTTVVSEPVRVSIAPEKRPSETSVRKLP
ncbi:MAG TPA: hypothetical protein VFQ35_10475 [Polyangiaceae bacterium]|nr:hypothetical protein [Polyangiaceae bacterium]